MDATGSAERAHFLSLPPDQQAAAVHRLAASGLAEYDIADATGWSVEQVRRVLGEHAQEVQRDPAA